MRLVLQEQGMFSVASFPGHATDPFCFWIRSLKIPQDSTAQTGLRTCEYCRAHPEMYRMDAEQGPAAWKHALPLYMKLSVEPSECWSSQTWASEGDLRNPGARPRCWEEWESPPPPQFSPMHDSATEDEHEKQKVLGASSKTSANKHCAQVDHEEVVKSKLRCLQEAGSLPLLYIEQV